MSLEERARKLTDHLHVVMEEASAADKKAAAAREELSWQEMRALRAVERQGCCAMSFLADKICLSVSSATGLIDRLVSKKLVKRDRSPNDRRVVEVALTDEGRAVNEQALAGSVEFARGLLKGLDASEQEALVGLLRKAAERIEAEKKPA